MRNIFIRTVAIGLCVLSVLCGRARAGQYDIKEMTPTIQTALENRRDRYEVLERLKDAGKIGENNSGYIEVFSSDETVSTTAQAENVDRRVIYTAIAEQNGLMDALQTIEKVFAEVQRNKAGSGQSIQLPGGEWVTK